MERLLTQLLVQRASGVKSGHRRCSPAAAGCCRSGESGSSEVFSHSDT